MTPYYGGWDTAKSGGTTNRNPYIEGTRERDEWLKGWIRYFETFGETGKGS